MKALRSWIMLACWCSVDSTRGAPLAHTTAAIAGCCGTRARSLRAPLLSLPSLSLPSLRWRTPSLCLSLHCAACSRRLPPKSKLLCSAPQTTGLRARRPRAVPAVLASCRSADMPRVPCGAAGALANPQRSPAPSPACPGRPPHFKRFSLPLTATVTPFEAEPLKPYAAECSVHRGSRDPGVVQP